MAETTTIEKKSNINPGYIAWLGLIGVFILIGVVAAVMVFWKGLILTNMSDTVPWGLWITIDLSAIALGAGAFTLSAIVYVFGLERFRPILRLAVLIGFIGYTSALLTLLLDIGRPDRFYHPWIYWNVHSVLWEITWCITIYLSILILEFLPTITDAKMFDRWPWVRKAAALLHKATPALALIGLAATFAVCGFFRDPDRIIPDKSGAVVSPADGKVIVTEIVNNSPFYVGNAMKISIFMSVFNVHVNRAPYDGIIKENRYYPGKFFSANLDKASLQNEHNALFVETEDGKRLCVVQIAGLIARRIVCYVGSGDRIRRGQRFGLICFGSRLDVYLPADIELKVTVGDKVKAGASILGQFA